MISHTATYSLGIGLENLEYVSLGNLYSTNYTVSSLKNNFRINECLQIQIIYTYILQHTCDLFSESSNWSRFTSQVEFYEVSNEKFCDKITRIDWK